MTRLFFIVLLVLPFGAFCEIPEWRQKQLDSFVTNLPREVVRDLDSAHYYMDTFATSEEERVFSFYGFLSIHFRYDTKRAGKGKSIKEYTPFYTCRKRSGVCRDFAFLFKELCDRSTIPCVFAHGRAKGPWRAMAADVIRFRPKASNHAWNIVKFNGSWHLIDATWTSIEKVDKYYEIDENGRKKYVTKAKRPNREYYCSDPALFYMKRSAVHPAYYVSSYVPTYKSARRKRFPKRTYAESYDFETVLDSLSANSYYRFTADFEDTQRVYAKRYGSNGYYWYYLQSFLDLKRTNKNALTIDSCNAFLAELERMKRYLQSRGGGGVHRIDGIRLLVVEHITKLKKREERRAKNATYSKR